MTKIWVRTDHAEEYTEGEILEDVIDFPEDDLTNPIATIKLRWDDPPADYFKTGKLFLISERLKQVVAKYTINAIFYPVRILLKGQDWAEGSFYHCDIRDHVECLDFKNGEYVFWEKEKFSDHVRHIHRLAIDEAKTNGKELFRIAKGGENIVCVGDALAEDIKCQNFTGVRLIDPQEWSFGILVP